MKTFVSTVWLGRDRQRVWIRTRRDKFSDIEELRRVIEVKTKDPNQKPEEVLIISRERDPRQPELNLGI